MSPKAVEKCLNVHWGRWENLWAAGRPSRVLLVDAAALLAEAVYVITNPVKANLVTAAHLWPGLVSLPARLGRAQVFKRPSKFFREVLLATSRCKNWAQHSVGSREGALGLSLRCLLTVSLALGSSCFVASTKGAIYQGQSIPAKERIDRIVISKGRNVLQAWSKERLLKIYKVALGRGGAGPKRYEGDDKTPEGTYRIDHRFASKTYHRFLHLSYPNRSDRRAFKSGKAGGEIPSSASIGGAIGIHGEKKGLRWLPHKWMNWTRGCIALDNDEIEELYRLVIKNAVVVIKP